MLHNAPSQPAVQLFFFTAYNIQINPISVRAYFQFLVRTRVARIRLQKRFGHVTLPQLAAPSVRPRIGKDMQVPVSRQEPQKQRLLTPQQPHFRRALRVRLLTSPITIKSNRRCPLPPSLLRKSGLLHTFFQQ